MQQYWHRFEGRPDKIIIGKSKCEICGEIATIMNTNSPIRKDWPGFNKHAFPQPVNSPNTLRGR